MAADDLEPLLAKLATFAPLFGRAKDDIEAMVTRGRAGDYKGVMQNARLVLEALLRSLVTEELKQTPGKAMLDELVTKFRQQANAGLVPTTMLAHMGTVQAWGNLSAHDHAGSLADAPLTVGPDEVIASLNSLVAILTWYAGRKNLTGASSTMSAPAAPAAPKKPSLSTPMLLGTCVAAALGVAALVALKPHTGPSTTEVADFAALDALYLSWKEPVPPVSCRRAAEAASLATHATDVDALSLIDSPSPEAAYLLARARFEKGQKEPTLEKALACPNFAAAQYLAGKIAIADNQLAPARAHFEQALKIAPTFLDARVTRAGVLIKQGAFDEALAEADALVLAAPDYPGGFMVRALAKSAKDPNYDATAELCTAAKLGSAKARELLASTKCP